jgi:hypothetical protein
MNVVKTLTRVLGTILLTFWGLVFLALMFGAQPPPTTAASTPAETKPDPARDHRLRAAVQMLERVDRLQKQLITKCEQHPMPDCRNLIQTIQEERPKIKLGVVVSSYDEAQFMKIVDLVHTFEKSATNFLESVQ